MVRAPESAMLFADNVWVDPLMIKLLMVLVEVGATIADEKVLVPANVWDPVVTNPLLEPEASGILRVTVPPRATGEPETLKSEPDVPVETVMELLSNLDERS